MKKITFKQWVNYHDDYPENELSRSGGWFNGHIINGHNTKYVQVGDKIVAKKTPKELIADHTIEDYKERIGVEALPYFEALKEEILKNKLQVTGQQHQYQDYTPLFSDGTISTLSYRAWGDMMAAIYTTKKKPLTYMKFYM